MATSSQYNLKSPAVKRLMKEASELRHQTEIYFAQPLEENLFDWHFTIRGPKDSPYSEGIYHGRIILPTDYPLTPPHLYLLTPNGRFQTNKKICLTVSGHHPESWQPSWSIRTILLALIGFMPSPGLGTIGSLDYTTEERKELAKKSVEWNCNVCGSIKELLKERGEEECTTEVKKDDENVAKERLDQEMLSIINFKGDVEQQTIPQVTKIAAKINAQDDQFTGENNQPPTSERPQSEDSIPAQTNSTNHTNATEQSNRTTNSILARLSPTLIIVLIALIVLKRIYTFLF